MGPKKKKKVCLENFFSIVSIIQHSILWVWMMKIENKILYFQIIKYELQWQNGKKIKFVGPFFPSFFLSFLFFLLQTHSTTNGPFLSSSDPLNSQWFFFLLVFFFLSLFFFLSSSDPLHHVHRSNTQTQTHKHKPTTMAEDWFFYRVKWVGFA